MTSHSAIRRAAEAIIMGIERDLNGRLDWRLLAADVQQRRAEWRKIILGELAVAAAGGPGPKEPA